MSLNTNVQRHKVLVIIHDSLKSQSTWKNICLQQFDNRGRTSSSWPSSKLTIHQLSVTPLKVLSGNFSKCSKMWFPFSLSWRAYLNQCNLKYLSVDLSLEEGQLQEICLNVLLNSRGTNPASPWVDRFSASLRKFSIASGLWKLITERVGEVRPSRSLILAFPLASIQVLTVTWKLHPNPQQ